MSSTKNLNPEICHRIGIEYRPNTRGCGYKAIGARLCLPWQTVRNVCNRKKATGTSEARKRGRSPSLTAAEQRRVRSRLDKNPFATNIELASTVGNKVSRWTVGRVISHSEPPFTRKRVIDQEPEELSAEWKREVKRFIRDPLKRIPISTRIYEDETGIYSNEAPKYGRSRRGVPIRMEKPHYAKKWTLHVYAREKTVVHWELSARNANDGEVVRVLNNAAPKMRKDETLIWDRLGRSGRTANPKAQHYNPTIPDTLRQHGVKLLFLPPKGKYLQPLELLFDDLKEHHLRKRRPGKGPFWSEAELKRKIKCYMEDVAPKNLHGFFEARANGRYLKENGLLDE
jgi:transposase